MPATSVIIFDVTVVGKEHASSLVKTVYSSFPVLIVTLYRRISMNTEKYIKNSSTLSRVLRIGVIANAIVWVCSIIALIFIMQNASSEKGLFPILAGGLGVAVMLVSIVQKLRNSVDS